LVQGVTVSRVPRFLRQVVLSAAAFALAAAAIAQTQTAFKQPSFHERAVFSGLVNPTVVRFLRDGRILVAEKSGLIKMFDGFDDTTAAVVADLRSRTHNFWDRGLLGLAVPPGWGPSSPDEWRRYICVLYAPVGVAGRGDAGEDAGGERDRRRAAVAAAGDASYATHPPSTVSRSRSPRPAPPREFQG
jgi:hypothetical protein